MRAYYAGRGDDTTITAGDDGDGRRLREKTTRKAKKTSKSKESKKAHRDHGASTNSERSEKRKGRKKKGGDGLVGTDADFAALESETAYASARSSRVSEKNAAHHGTGADDADAMAKGSGLFPVDEGGGDIEMAGMVFDAETEY